MLINVVVRGQSNAELLYDFGATAALASRIQFWLGFDGTNDRVSVVASAYQPDGHNTLNSGTSFLTEWLSAAGGDWTRGWTDNTLETGFLATLSALPDEQRAAPTAILFLHNEYDSADATLSPAEFESAVRYDADRVRSTLGQGAATTPYIFVNVPYSPGTDTGNQAIKQAQEALAADPGFHAAIGARAIDLDMNWDVSTWSASDVYGYGHISPADADLLADRIARSIAQQFAGYAKPGSPVAQAAGDIADLGPQVLGADAVAGHPEQVLLTLGLEGGAPVRPLSSAAMQGIGWSVVDHGTINPAIAASLFDDTHVLLTFAGPVSSDGSAAVFYGYGEGRTALPNDAPTWVGGPGEGNAISDADGLPLWAPATGVTIDGSGAPGVPTWIGVTAPGTLSEPSAGAGVDYLAQISAPGLSTVWQAVFTAGQVAEYGWKPVSLDASGSASVLIHLRQSGDYVNLVDDPAAPAITGWSAPVTIETAGALPTWIGVTAPGTLSEPSAGAGVDYVAQISAPGLSTVWQAVFTAGQVAEYDWTPVSLDASGSASVPIHLRQSGDYVNLVDDPAAPAITGWSAPVTVVYQGASPQPAAAQGPQVLPESGSRAPGIPDATLRALSNGINIQGWGFWDSNFHVDQSAFADLAAQGFRHVRIYWDIAQTPEFAGYPTDEAGLAGNDILDRIDTAIGNAVAAGLKVIINGVPGLDTGNPDNLAAQIAFEALYARHLVNRFGAGNVILEVANEPAMESQAACEQAQGAAIRAIRAAVGEGPTIVEDVNIRHDGAWTQTGALDDLQPDRADPNIVWSFHCYDPVDFTWQSYGPAVFPGDPALAASAPNPNVQSYYATGQNTALAVERQIDWAALQADNRGAVLMEGEFGVNVAADEASRLAYMAAQAEALAADGLGWAYWQAYSNDMTIEQLTVDAAGVQHSSPIDPAVLTALGLAAPPRTPYTVAFASMAEADAIAPFDGRTISPGGEQTLNAAGLVGAALTPDASARVSASDNGLTVSGLSGWDSLGAVGIADGRAHDVTVDGFQRAMIRLDNTDASPSQIAVTARDAYVRSGTGGGSIAVTLSGPSRIGGTANILAGGGDTTISVTVSDEPDEAAPANAGGSIAGMRGNDTVNLAAQHGGFAVQLGSGNDVVNILGMGRTDGARDTLDAGVGFDTLNLRGVRADYVFAGGTDATGNYIDADSARWGSYRLRNFESVSFAADGSESAATLPLRAADATGGAAVPDTTPGDSVVPVGSDAANSAMAGDAAAVIDQTLWTSPGTDILAAGHGSDTLFVDCTNPDGWASIRDFGPGDMLDLVGLDWNVGSARWIAGSDPQGESGATLAVDLHGTGGVDALVTLVGVPLATAEGFLMDAGSLDGVPFLAVHG